MKGMATPVHRQLYHGVTIDNLIYPSPDVQMLGALNGNVIWGRKKVFAPPTEHTRTIY